jgi:adenine-specific DNA-methyltransferase
MKSPLVNSLYRPNLRYEFHGIEPPPNGWLYSKERMEALYAKNELVMPESSTGRIYRKIYADTYQGQLIQNIWIDIPIVNPMAKERIEGFAKVAGAKIYQPTPSAPSHASIAS